ncbi:MAG: hypothetical protein KZQ64_14220, partial [gamma proteobacterium symbiont of Bathyaustriella thionipta]|nr:hypothetical protein [gamma proteobacterium symbiont of Bathyaustriella thionipta]
MFIVLKHNRKMATGFDLNKILDEEGIEDSDIELIASILRNTGKFHVVPKFDNGHVLSFNGESQTFGATPSSRATSTPTPFGEQTSIYRAVRPPTPIITTHNPVVSFRPPTLGPIREEPTPLPHIAPLTLTRGPPAFQDYLARDQKGLGGRVPVSTQPDLKPPSTGGGPRPVLDLTYRAHPVAVKTEDKPMPQTTFCPTFPYHPSYHQ